LLRIYRWVREEDGEPVNMEKHDELVGAWRKLALIVMR